MSEKEVLAWAQTLKPEWDVASDWIEIRPDVCLGVEVGYTVTLEGERTVYVVSTKGVVGWLASN